MICHDGIEKIEERAFQDCPSLRRVTMPGVKVLEKHTFYRCYALTYIECGKLQIIGDKAFVGCRLLSSTDLRSTKIVGKYAFGACINLINAKFGKELESIGVGAFYNCRSLERITLPLKDGMIIDDSIFQRCEKLNHVNLVGGLHNTFAALLLDGWRNDMNEEIDAINQVLPNIHLLVVCIKLGIRPRRYGHGLDQFSANIITTKQSIAAI